MDTNSQEFKFILLHNLFGPIQYLEELKKISQKKYKIWKNRLVKNTNNVGVYGDLFELYITWTLVMKNIEFETTDSPDFKVLHNNSNIYIECTSSQFDFEKKPSKDDILQKISDTIYSKLNMNYANTSTCLFIDITNLCYHAKMLNSTISNKELMLSIVKASQKIPMFESSQTFGAFMFFCFNITRNSKGEIRYACNSFNIIENTSVEPNLVDFLKTNNGSTLDKQTVKTIKFNHEI